MLVEIWNGITFLSPLWNPGPRVILLHHVHIEMWNMPSGPSWAPSGPCSKRRSPRRMYASGVLGVKIRDYTAGYRAYRATVLRRVEADATRATGYGFQVELAYRAHRQGATIVEVPITFNDRVRGESKMSWHIIGEAMSLVTWWGFRDRVLRRGRRPDVPSVDAPDVETVVLPDRDDPAVSAQAASDVEPASS